MKKAIISQHMRGLTVDEILCNREALTKQLAAKGYQVIDTVFTEEFPGIVTAEQRSRYCLGKVISLFATVDLVVFVDGWESARGCRVEHYVCEQYDIPHINACDVAKLP